MPLHGLRYKVSIHMAKDDFEISQIKIQTRELVHSTKCIGYRLAIADKIITYCTDTGRCNNALKLAHQADLFIAECALRKDQDDEGWPHLNPIDAALLAKEAGVKRLVLTHFDAYNFKSIRERKLAQIQARKIFPHCLAAIDNIKIKI